MKNVATSLLLSLSLGIAAVAQAATPGSLLVLNKSDNTATLIELESKKTLATIPTGVGPHEVAISPDGGLAVVADYGDQTPGNTLTVIDVRAGKQTRRIDLGEYRRPHGLAWLQGNEVAVTVEANKALLIVDVSTGKVMHAIPTGQEVSHMVVTSAKHHRAFVANIGSGSVTVIDLAQKKHAVDIATGKGAEGIDISPDETQVWVTNRGANTVSVIDAATLKVIATLDSKSFPIRAKFTPDGKHVLVSNAQSGDVSVFDAATRQQITRIPMQAGAKAATGDDRRLFGSDFSSGPVPVGILMAPGLDVAFVANTNADRVSVIDLKTWTVVDRLTAGRQPDGLGYARPPAQRQ